MLCKNKIKTSIPTLQLYKFIYSQLVCSPLKLKKKQKRRPLVRNRSNSRETDPLAQVHQNRRVTDTIRPVVRIPIEGLADLTRSERAR